MLNALSAAVLLPLFPKLWGYVGVEEVESIASFIAGLDPGIPYSLLAFYPQFYMNDLPMTSKKEAIECIGAARKYLKRVRIGNIQLLS